VATAALGLLGLLGWILGMPLLSSIRSSYIPMAPLTSIAFLCLGGLLLVHSMGPSQGSVGILAAVLSALLSVYGLIELVEYLGIPVLSLEEWLFPNPPMIGAISTGRMSPTTAAILLLSGAVVPMLFLRERGGERQKLFGDLAGCLGILVAVVGTVFVLSYLHGAPFLYGTMTIPMAATTALAVLLLGTGQVLAVGPDSFPSRLIAGPSARARLLRVFVSTTVGVVVAIDLMHVYARWIFFEDNAFMSGVSITVFAVITGALIARVALKVGDDMDRSEEVRRGMEETLQKQFHFLQVILDAIPAPVFYKDARGFFLGCNKAYEEYIGLPKDRLVGKTVCDIAPKDLADVYRDADDALFRKGGSQVYETEMVPADDKRHYVIFNEATFSNPDGSLGGLVGTILDITERKLAEEVLKESEEKFRLIFDNASDGILLADTESMKFEMGNRKICEMFGYSEEEILRLRVLDIHPGKDLPYVLAGFQSGTTGEINMAMDIPMKRKDGSVFFADIATSLITFHGKQFQMGIFRDLTRERILQKQLQTAQRMEAVGTLAGGIAHDFNNALTGIFGFAEMLKLQLAGNERALSDVNEILRCAERAAILTRQLLTYARKQIIEPVNLSLNKVITDLMKLVSKVVGEHFEIRTFLAKDLPTICADVGQIEQVIMNLVLNARDAMPGGGQILLETDLVDLDAEYVRYHPYMKVGSHVVLTVSDTGVGMDQKTQERVFEPFFTTKGQEKGTGLGLAMVYGIVKQHNGFIHLYSEPEKGTTFKIYFPPVEAAPDVIVSSKPSEIRGGTETILLADDDESVRMLVDRTLKDLGYTVLVASNGEDAVTVFRENRERISLALLDVVMPLKGGKKAYEEMHNVRADLKVIFLSGYTANAVHESFILIAGIPFLSKPFGPGALARKVREVLDAPC
jgi:PAS domain S-box-containing protein